jgi:hypothetical protein
MRSILYQLKKYSDKQVPIKIEQQVDQYIIDNIYLLAKRIVDKQYKIDDPLHDSHISSIIEMLKDMPNSIYINTLFSEEIFAIYHCYYHHHNQVVSETTTDKFFKEFLSTVNPDEYQKNFEEAVDETTKKLAVIRILIATFTKDNHTTNTTSGQFNTIPLKKEDILPLEFRQQASEYLGVNSILEAIKLQEQLNKYVSIDQIILGRLGYMIFWNWNNRGNMVNIPLLSAPKKERN